MYILHTALFLLFFTCVQCAVKPTFKAAVYEHALIFPPAGSVVVTRQEALRLMQQNLDIYKEQAKMAGAKGADILVFPEDGVYGYIFNRKSIVPYLEYIPDPRTETWNPCDEPSRYPNTEVQQTLSCMAKGNSLYLVANIGDRQPCNRRTDMTCPQDGQYQYNTNVVYNQNGTLIGRYHKQHLYREYQFNVPQKVDIAYFETPFGKFGTFICFDVLYPDPAIQLIEKYQVGNIVFPTAWMDSLPLLAAIQFHSAFAMRMGVNFLAANLHFPKRRFHGSGIYTPDGAAVFYYNNSMSSGGKLLIADIDVITKPQRATISPKTDIDHTLNKDEFQSKLSRDLFTFVPVSQRKGTIVVCQNKLCCQLDYSFVNDTKELYAFGAFDGWHKTYKWRNCLQVCTIVRCGNTSRESCGSRNKIAYRHYSRLRITGNFSTGYIFPEVLLSDQQGALLLAPGQFNFANQSLVSTKGFNRPLVSAGLYGRVYERDIPEDDEPSPGGATCIKRSGILSVIIAFAVTSFTFDW